MLSDYSIDQVCYIETFYLWIIASAAWLCASYRLVLIIEWRQGAEIDRV